jgi:hypothetical protein
MTTISTESSADGYWMICPECHWVYSLIGKAITSTSGGMLTADIVIDSIPHPSIPLANRHHQDSPPEHPSKTCKRVIRREETRENDGRAMMIGTRCGTALLEHPDQDACRAAFRIGGIDAVSTMLEDLLRSG